MRAAHLTGLTSNPTIFRAAVLGTDRYRTRLRHSPAFPPEVAYDALSIEEVRAAADALAPLFRRSDGADGFVSLEVAPTLAHDADGTVAAALSLWERIARPSAMIKIPATPAGVEATRRATAAGVNINVRLPFSVDRYAAIADAYVDGLDDRVRRGAPVDGIASVASFFVTRVDTAVDPLLAAPAARTSSAAPPSPTPSPRFARATDLFAGSRFAALRAAGAPPQRLVWASTATKDPAYSDVEYVDELAGPGVVNTMPPATLSAYADHGAPADRLTGTERSARATLDRIAAADVDLRTVTEHLLEHGVAVFAGSIDDLLAGLAEPQVSPA